MPSLISSLFGTPSPSQSGIEVMGSEILALLKLQGSVGSVPSLTSSPLETPSPSQSSFDQDEEGVLL